MSSLSSDVLFVLLSLALLFVVQVTARVNSRPPLKLQSFDGLVDHSCMEDQEKKGGLFSKVYNQIMSFTGMSL